MLDDEETRRSATLCVTLKGINMVVGGRREHGAVVYRHVEDTWYHTTRRLIKGIISEILSSLEAKREAR